jgi:hypothetical protein
MLQLQGASVQLAVYEIPDANPESYAPPDRIATDRPDVYSALVREGIKGVKDGESVTFAQLGAQDVPQNLITITRSGDYFEIRKNPDVEPEQVSIAQAETDEPAPLTVGEAELRDFWKGYENNGSAPGDYMGKMSARQDRLGEASRRLGFPSIEDTGKPAPTRETAQTLPLPGTVKANAEQLREQGVPVPDISLSGQGEIDAEPFVDVWDEEGFPTSEQLWWALHDLTQEHYAGLMPFIDRDMKFNVAMRFAKLYAGAVKSLGPIPARIYPDQYAINAPVPQKVVVSYEGDQKIGHATDVLDSFSSELQGLGSQIDMDPESDKLTFPPIYNDYLDEMVSVITLSDPHREGLEELLRIIESDAFQDGTFSYETFSRDLLAEAQRAWKIEPKPEPERAPEPEYSPNDLA